jgi:hypothetical protein
LGLALPILRYKPATPTTAYFLSPLSEYGPLSVLKKIKPPEPGK